jgi:beta-glucanase (GH16 family)
VRRNAVSPRSQLILAVTIVGLLVANVVVIVVRAGSHAQRGVDVGTHGPLCGRSRAPSHSVAQAPGPSTSPPASSPPAGSGQLVFFDGFSGTRLDCARWSLYSGQPKSSAAAYWKPSQVSVRDGMLTLRTSYDRALGKYVSGGLDDARARDGVQTYGTYLMRFRMDSGNGVGDVALLYPAGGGWPPEIDFTESGGSRTTSVATLHYGSTNHEIHRTVQADFTKWHVAGVTWRPGVLQYSLDGHVYATVRSSQVPDVPMWLGIQTQASVCTTVFPATCRTPSTPATVDMDVDWVAVYR